MTKDLAKLIFIQALGFVLRDSSHYAIRIIDKQWSDLFIAHGAHILLCELEDQALGRSFGVVQWFLISRDSPEELF